MIICEFFVEMEIGTVPIPFPLTITLQNVIIHGFVTNPYKRKGGTFFMRRTKELAKAVQRNSMMYMLNRNVVPTQHLLVIGTRTRRFKIEPPRYKDKSEYLNDKQSNRPFVEISLDDYNWLYDFADSILESKKTSTSSFYNHTLDYMNPGMAAFRIYNGTDFIHVQVRKTPEINSMYQLDFFEPSKNNSMVLKMVLLCDVSDAIDVGANIVYVNQIRESNWVTTASKISTSFHDILIYLRIWEYSEDEKLCIIRPLPEKIFGKPLFP